MELKTLTLVLAISLTIPTLAQRPWGKEQLGIPVRETHLRQADVMWSKAIWREIDLRQKMNHPFYYPIEPINERMSLFHAILNEIKEGYLTAYSPGPLGTSDNLSIPLTSSAVNRILTKIDTIRTLDPDTEEIIEVHVEQTIEASDILRYRIKEEWIFDSKHSRMVPRIISIAPMYMVYGEDGEARGLRVLFWIDYKQARFGLAQYPVFIRYNDNSALTFDDLFVKRLFDSYIIKKSNPADRYIHEYARGLDALIEGESIEEEIRIFESDLWSH